MDIRLMISELRYEYRVLVSTLIGYYLIVRYKGLGYLCEWNIKDSKPIRFNTNTIRWFPSDSCYEHWMNASLYPWVFRSHPKYFPWSGEELTTKITRELESLRVSNRGRVQLNQDYDTENYHP